MRQAVGPLEPLSSTVPFFIKLLPFVARTPSQIYIFEQIDEH
jgi:hypothetical protein